MNHNLDNNIRMGYNTNRYGRAYNNYRMAKRNYTQTHDMDAKHKMDESSRDHLADTIATVKEMWTDADPNMKMQMKQDLNRLVQEMVI